MSGSDSEAPDTRSDELSRGQLRGSTLLTLGRFLALGINVATQVVIVRTLSKDDFGAFGYALALAAGARVLLSLGQGRALSRFMATYQEQRDPARMFGAMLLAAGTVLTTGAVTIAAFYLFQDALIASVVGPQGVDVVLVLLFVAPLEALDQVFLSVFAVFGRPMAIFVRKHLLAPMLRLAVVVALAAAGADVEYLAVGYLAASALGIGLYVVMFARLLHTEGLGADLRSNGVVVPVRDVMGFSLPMLTAELALLSLSLAGVVALGVFHSVAEVADFRAVFSAARLNTAVNIAFATLFLPLIARLHARADYEGLRRSYWQTAAVVSVVTFPIFAVTGPLSPATTVTLFGERYADSAAVLTTLAVGYYVNVALGFNTYALQVAGRLRLLVGLNLFTIVLNVGLCLALVPTFGAVGAAGANSLALLVQNLVCQLALRTTLQSGFIDRTCLGCYLSIVAAAVALAVFQLVFTPGIFVSVPAATVASLLVLASSRRALRLGDTFPELRRLPLVGRVVA